MGSAAGLAPIFGFVAPSRAHVEPSGPSMLGQVGPMLSYVGFILGPCRAKLGLCWPMLSPLASYVGAMFGTSILKRS